MSFIIRSQLNSNKAIYKGLVDCKKLYPSFKSYHQSKENTLIFERNNNKWDLSTRDSGKSETISDVYCEKEKKLLVKMSMIDVLEHSAIVGVFFSLGVKTIGASCYLFARESFQMIFNWEFKLKRSIILCHRL